MFGRWHCGCHLEPVGHLELVGHPEPVEGSNGIQYLWITSDQVLSGSTRDCDAGWLSVPPILPDATNGDGLNRHHLQSISNIAYRQQRVEGRCSRRPGIRVVVRPFQNLLSLADLVMAGDL